MLIDTKTPSAHPHPSVANRDIRSARTGIFRKEGEYWTIGYGGHVVRLKDTKGVAYLAFLLRHPGAEYHALAVVGGSAIHSPEDHPNPSMSGLPQGDQHLDRTGIHIGGLSDAGEMLDDHAKAAYRRRLAELREALADAKQLGHIERAERVEQEIGALTKELARAVGLGGRNRRAGSASERARQSVSKAIKGAVDRLAQHDPALGHLLARCIKVGTFCSYQPDPHCPMEWECTATPIEPAEPPTPGGMSMLGGPLESPAVLGVSPLSLAPRTAFVGRETECGALRARIDRALHGHGSLVMLRGGPGVGKTRLALEMAAYAGRVGFRSFVGHCYERDEPVPYLPFVEIIESGLAHTASLDAYRQGIGDNAAELAQIAPWLRRIFPDIPASRDLLPAQRRRYLFQSLAEALGRVARKRPQFLVLDDLHWADEATLALLNHVANGVAQLPVVIMGTYRDGYAAHNPALGRTLEELRRLGIHPLKLGGLSKDAVVLMLTDLSQRQVPDHLVDVIFEASQGNPFFVEEVYRHLLEGGHLCDAAGAFRTDLTVAEGDVPDNVRALIGRWLERLDAQEKRVLAAAAVIGRSFSFGLLSAISQIDVEALCTVIEKAQQLDIIVPSSEGPDRPLTFRDELARQTLLAGIAAPRQQQLHAGVADAMERLYPGAVNERAGDIVDHLRKAGSFADARKLAHYLVWSQ